MSLFVWPTAQINTNPVKRSTFSHEPENVCHFCLKNTWHVELIFKIVISFSVGWLIDLLIQCRSSKLDVGHFFSPFNPLHSSCNTSSFDIDIWPGRCCTRLLCLEIAFEKQVLLCRQDAEPSMHPPPLLPVERIISWWCRGGYNLHAHSTAWCHAMVGMAKCEAKMWAYQTF